jgi:hypothetical protein
VVVGFRGGKVGEECLYLLATDGDRRRVALVREYLAWRYEAEFVQMGQT